MIIFLAALARRAEAPLRVGGARRGGRWQRLRHVTLPTISPVILFAVVIGVIEALQYFTQAYVASTVAAAGAGGRRGDATNELGYPQDSTLFYPVLLYQQGFRYFNMGYASAMAVILLFVALAVTLVILRALGPLGPLRGRPEVGGGGDAAPADDRGERPERRRPARGRCAASGC